METMVKCEVENCKNKAQELHSCPFKSEIENDSTLCNCCEKHERSCAREI
jgi:hypothetical protein